MTKRRTAVAVWALDDYPAIEEGMICCKKPWAEVMDLCVSKRTEIRFNNDAVAQLTWRQSCGGVAVLRHCQRLCLLGLH